MKPQKLSNTIMFKTFFFLLPLFLLLQSCIIAFNSYDIDSSVQNFSVEQFETTAGSAPPTLGQQFSEQLKQRILSDTKLNYAASKGDIEFSGAIVGFEVSPIAPRDAQSVALQRLTIRMNISYKNRKQVDKDWNTAFSRFSDFGADIDLSSVEERLVREIYEQVIEDVFNKAFANW